MVGCKHTVKKLAKPHLASKHLPGVPEDEVVLQDATPCPCYHGPVVLRYVVDQLYILNGKIPIIFFS
jgi:hypothetical protein